MELVKNIKVYCFGTKDGKGVIEALEKKGGVNRDPLFGNSTELIYYIDPVTNSIMTAYKNTSVYNLVISNYTEIQPLKTKRWRAGLNKPYYTIIINNGMCTPHRSKEGGYNIDDGRYNSGNYYRTQEECLKVADACNKLIYGSIHSEE